MKKIVFYLLSVIWGLPMTLIGVFTALLLMAFGYRPKRYGWCWHFAVGTKWGGVSLGLIFITDDSSSASTRNHEHGHTFQNCLWGPLFPFVIAIPSVTRYWIRELQLRQGKMLKPYNSIWFESQASKWGDAFIYSLENQDNCK